MTAPVEPMAETELDKFESWLRGLAERGGKGVVGNIDARSLGRIADAIAAERRGRESAAAAIDEIATDRDLYRSRWLSCVTPEEAERLQARIALLEAALRPFVDCYQHNRCDITDSDVARAADALAAIVEAQLATLKATLKTDFEKSQDRVATLTAAIAPFVKAAEQFDDEGLYTGNVQIGAVFSVEDWKLLLAATREG
jgi:hypothetical protein